MCYLAGSLVKILLSQEIFVASVSDLKLSVTNSSKMFCMFCLVEDNSKIKNTLTVGYNLFIVSSTCRSLFVIRADLVFY